MPQYGINLDPDHKAGLPLQAQDLSGLKWVRFVFQAQPHQKRTIQQSCQFYAPLIDTYRALGIRTLLILNHQSFVGDEPWKRSNGNWRSYAADFSIICGEIARYFKDRGVAYELGHDISCPYTRKLAGTIVLSITDVKYENARSRDRAFLLT